MLMFAGVTLIYSINFNPNTAVSNLSIMFVEVDYNNNNNNNNNNK